ncbi:MAG TPA: cell wall hydrolase [Beijerinckiaceae bacterium]|nr:cell wall hydrolase [Beijerinckiaceae bacterium]
MRLACGFRAAGRTPINGKRHDAWMRRTGGKRMGRSRIGWALGVVAPWCLGMGLLVSITADAGQDFASGASLAPIEARAALQPRDLVPSSALSGNLGSFGSRRGILREARLAIGPSAEFHSTPDELTPRAKLKPRPGHFPMIVRSTKSDPFVALRPSFETRMNKPGGLQQLRAADLMFHIDESGLASTFQPFDGEATGPDSVAKFEPWDADDAPVTAPSPGGGGTSPTQGGSVITVRPAVVAARNAQGATPVVPRAYALGSTTPAPADSTPVEIVAAPGAPRVAKARPNTTVVSRAPDGRPDYLALVGRNRLESEKKCLAQAIYFESRSEPEDGQAAVAQVILNRVGSGLYPNTICGVVFQNRHRYKACQFSFACEGKSLRITDQDSWGTASRIAEEVLDGKTWIADVGASTHYHANYVRPRWARHLKKMDVIGKHIFYRLKPGQT